MQIMKFTDRRYPRKQHLQECHARGVVYLIRRELIGRTIHGFTPGPERIALSRAAMLGSSTNHALKRVRVDVDETGKNGAIRKAHGLRQVRTIARESNDASIRTSEHGQPGFERAAGIGQIGQPAGLRWIRYARISLITLPATSVKR